MRIPLSEKQIGIVVIHNGILKNKAVKVGYFIPDYYYHFDFYSKQGNRIMSFKDFKILYPIKSKYSITTRYKYNI